MSSEIPAPAGPPLAAYAEAGPLRQRRFRLYAHELEVEMRWLVGPRETSRLTLEVFSDRSETVLIPNRFSRNALFTGLLGLVAGLSLALPLLPPEVRALAPLAGSFGVVCLLLAGISRARIVVARFPRIDGRTALEIRRTGTHAREFDPFVAALRRAVRQRR